MAVEIIMEGQLESTMVAGTLEGFVNAINLQSNQGKQFILAADPDGEPIGLNLSMIVKIRAQTPEDAFFNDTIT